MPKFYAVRRGRSTGIYNSWAECQRQVDRYPLARFKSFSTIAEAKQFLEGRDYVKSYGGGYSATGGRHATRPTSVSSRPVVYSDGCCFSNGGWNAEGGVGVYWGDDNPHNVSEKLIGPQTNQRAELTAAYRAVEGAIAQGFSSIEVKTDSTYTIKAMTEWISKWERNGWKTVNGQGVKNKADIEKLSNICSQIDVQWTHVSGHQGIPGNEKADQLAKQGSRK